MEITPVDWAGIVNGVIAGDKAAMEQLYNLFHRGIRYYFYRHTEPSSVEDRVNDVYITVVQAIKAGSLRQPDRLMGFVIWKASKVLPAEMIEAFPRSRRSRDVAA